MFATLYDTAFILAERRGLREIRRALLSQATGRVLELGAGTGINIAHYPATVGALVLTEPDPFMAAKLRKRAYLDNAQTAVVEAPGEVVPVEDSTIDTVVSTLVLCTVKDQGKTLAEIARILRPGGKFLFIEHVRSDRSAVAFLQDKLNTPWSWYARGCQCNRDTVAAIGESTLRVSEIRKERLRWISPLTHPLVVGVATHNS